MNNTAASSLQVHNQNSYAAALARRFASIVAPGLVTRTFRGRAFFEGFDPETGEILTWRPCDETNPSTALSAHAGASLSQAPADVSEGWLRAAGLLYAPEDEACFFSIDLDGGYDVLTTIAKLEEIFGEGSFLITTGSGRAGRYRLQFLIDRTAIATIQDRVSRILISAGLPPTKGGLEAFPSSSNGRIPFGIGGCFLFSRDLSSCVSRPPGWLLSAFEKLPVIDLKKLSEGLPEPERASRRSSRRHPDPANRRERPRATPRYIRQLWANGLPGPGCRHRMTYLLGKDCVYSGLSQDETISKLTIWTEAGGMSLSDDVQRNGVGWAIRQIPGIVRGIYRNVPILGIPDPVPMSGDERRRMRELAESAATEEDPASVCFVFLSRFLPWFKAAQIAGLPMLRMHSDVWQKLGGVRYRRLRELLGIFHQATGHKSIKTALANGGKASDAYARSWTCSFRFDLDTPIPPDAPVVDPVSCSVVRRRRHVPSIVSQKAARLYVHHEEFRVLTREQKQDPGKTKAEAQKPSTRKRPTRRPKFPIYRPWQPRLEDFDGSLDRYLELIEEHHAENRKRGAEKRKRTLERRRARELEESSPSDAPPLLPTS